MTEKLEKLERLNVSGLDDLLGVKLPVLNDGFVRLIDYMGDDSSIVQAARISYGKGTKKVSEDEGLIRYLMRHNHTTPFEMCELKLHVRVPMDCWRQWIRHRMASVNEYSTRYSEAIDSCQTTRPSEWRIQSKNNKQGSEGLLIDVDKYKHDALVDAETLSEKESAFQRTAQRLYQERLEAGVAKEQARKDLPLSTYTEAYWKIDLKNLLHFLGLRMDAHAQKEIRDYATVIGEQIVARWVPLTWAAFNDYNPLRGAITLSARDIAVIKNHGDLTIPRTFGWLELNKEGKLKDNRERLECEAKLRMLDIGIPWGSYYGH